MEKSISEKSLTLVKVGVALQCVDVTHQCVSVKVSVAPEVTEYS